MAAPNTTLNGTTRERSQHLADRATREPRALVRRTARRSLCGASARGPCALQSSPLYRQRGAQCGSIQRLRYARSRSRRTGLDRVSRVLRPRCSDAGRFCNADESPGACAAVAAGSQLPHNRSMEEPWPLMEISMAPDPVIEAYKKDVDRTLIRETELYHRRTCRPTCSTASGRTRE